MDYIDLTVSDDECDDGAERLKSATAEMAPIQFSSVHHAISTATRLPVTKVARMALYQQDIGQGMLLLSGELFTSLFGRKPDRRGEFVEIPESQRSTKLWRVIHKAVSLMGPSTPDTASPPHPDLLETHDSSGGSVKISFRHDAREYTARFMSSRIGPSRYGPPFVFVLRFSS